MNTFNWKLNSSRLILFLCVILILFNCILQFRDSAAFVRHIKSHSYQAPGEEFFLLRPYLSQVPHAGYVTCQESQDSRYDPDIMFHFQQAQFALSPTLLDYFQALNHTWVILYCQNPVEADKKLKALSASPVAILNNGIILAKRDLK